MIIGGLITGLSWFVPFLGGLNICLCLWAWVGSIVAIYISKSLSDVPLTKSDGAKIGVYCGLLGAAIFFIISIPLTALEFQNITAKYMELKPIANDPKMMEILEKLQNNKTLQILSAIISGFISSIFIIGFSVLGGMLGVKLFEKRTLETPIPPVPPV